MQIAAKLGCKFFLDIIRKPQDKIPGGFFTFVHFHVENSMYNSSIFR